MVANLAMNQDSIIVPSLIIDAALRRLASRVAVCGRAPGSNHYSA